MEKEIKVAMILYTQGLEYDDRIRKEILTLQERIPQVKFTIFAAVSKNEEKSGTTDYGVPYYIPYLKSRDKYASGTKVLQKAFDFYKTIKPKLKGFDIVWCADVETFLFPLLLPRSTKLIWDQHEIPERFTGNRLMKIVFRYMEGKCNIMYHANQPRIDYLASIGAIKNPNDHIAIRNYPESLDSSVPQPDDKFAEFQEWMSGRKCVYVQGISGNDRKGFETLSAVLNCKDLCAVVVGNVDKAAIEQLDKAYDKKTITTRVFFAGKLPQKMTKLYISECVLALVFYATNTPNNIYCEPNRMFQSIMQGIPVIVGNNPSMKDVVEKYELGISLNNDGSDIESITKAIGDILSDYDHYKKNVMANRDKLCWSHQEDLLAETFKKTIKLN